MKLLPHWVLTDRHPGFYDHESASAIEMTAKVYKAMQDMITEYNSFVDEINASWKEYRETGSVAFEEFQVAMEQKFSDFVKVITLKYQSQDVVLQNAVQEIISNIPVYLAESLDVMYENGEFDEIVYQSIGNLKRDFDTIATNTNNFQSTMTESFNNLVNDIELFKQNAETDFTNLENDLNSKFENLVFESDIADMQKVVYDTDNNGVVDNSENLGGYPPEYYAKRYDLELTNTNVSTLNGNINSMNTQLRTIQQAVLNANSKADNAMPKNGGVFTGDVKLNGGLDISSFRDCSNVPFNEIASVKGVFVINWTSPNSPNANALFGISDGWTAIAMSYIGEIYITTIEKSSWELMSVSKSGGDFTGAVNIPSQIGLVGDSWNAFTWKSNDHKTRGSVMISNTNRIHINQQQTGSEFEERYQMPPLADNLTADVWYKIMTTKDIKFNSTTATLEITL